MTQLKTLEKYVVEYELNEYIPVQTLEVTKKRLESQKQQREEYLSNPEKPLHKIGEKEVDLYQHYNNPVQVYVLAEKTNARGHEEAGFNWYGFYAHCPDGGKDVFIIRGTRGSSEPFFDIEEAYKHWLKLCASEEERDLDAQHRALRRALEEVQEKREKLTKDMPLI